MVAEVNKIIAGELLNHRSVVIPGVGTLYVAHRGARRLSRQKIAAPRNEIDFRPSEEAFGLSTFDFSACAAKRDTDFGANSI